MNHRPSKPSESQNLLSDILGEAEKSKVKLTPEIDRYIRSHLEAAQEKLERGEKLTHADLAFMEKAREMIELERFKQVELAPQYGKRLETLATFDFIESPKNPVIKGIDKKKYPAPTLEQIMAKVTPEKAELIKKYIKKPLLLIVPFAMPLKTIKTRAGQKKGRLDQKPVSGGASYINSDLPNLGKGESKLFYFPENYDQAAHGGLSKSEVLESETHNAFPGWQVLVVDGTETVPKDTLNKLPHTLKAEFDALGLGGLTPEDWLTLHIEGALKGIPFDDARSHSINWNLASYEEGGCVPNAHWETEWAYLSGDSPEDRGPSAGARRAVRL